MIRNLKVLGLALVAVFAMSAMVASAASAQVFTSAQNTTTITAGEDEKHVFSVTGQTVECETAFFSGEETGTSITSVTMEPEYTGCTAKLGTSNISATVTGFGHLESEAGKGNCEYEIDADGTVDLVCDAGVEVTVDAATCVVHIPPQNNLGTITYTNNANGTVTASINITKITTNHTDGFLCPLPSGGHGTTATLTGKSTVSGENAEGGAVAVTRDP